MPKSVNGFSGGLHIRGLRQRWLVNAVLPVFALVTLAVIIYVLSSAQYYYGNMRTGLETRARAAADKTLWARALAEIGTGALPPLWENLGEIDVETVLVCGAEDAKFSAVADAMRARLPRSRVVRVPACGHAPHLEAAD